MPAKVRGQSPAKKIIVLLIHSGGFAHYVSKGERSRKKICEGLITLTLVLGLAIISFPQPRRKRGVVFTGGGANMGAVVNRNRKPQSSDLYAKSKSRKRVPGRGFLGTTYGGNGQSNLRKRIK